MYICKWTWYGFDESVSLEIIVYLTVDRRFFLVWTEKLPADKSFLLKTTKF